MRSSYSLARDPIVNSSILTEHCLLRIWPSSRVAAVYLLSMYHGVLSHPGVLQVPSLKHLNTRKRSQTAIKQIQLWVYASNARKLLAADVSSVANHLYAGKDNQIRVPTEKATIRPCAGILQSMPEWASLSVSPVLLAVSMRAKIFRSESVRGRVLQSSISCAFPFLSFAPSSLHWPCLQLCLWSAVSTSKAPNIFSTTSCQGGVWFNVLEASVEPTCCVDAGRLYGMCSRAADLARAASLRIGKRLWDYRSSLWLPDNATGGAECRTTP